MRSKTLGLARVLHRCFMLAGDEQDPALIDRWGGQTLEHLLALVNSDQAPASGCMSLMGMRRPGVGMGVSESFKQEQE